MKNGKYQNGGRSFGSKSIAALLAVVLMMTCAVGGTIAWLTDTTDEVENTFTVGNIDITLEETKTDFKMIPGWTIDKDPIVTVKANSEDCWVFVKVEESKNLKDYIDYTIDPNNWTELKNAQGIAPNEAVYYCYAKDITADRAIKVLLNNQVKVKDTVTKEMMDSITGENRPLPKLIFTAYAVQLKESNNDEFTAAEAWAKAAPKTADDGAGDAQG